MLTDGSWSPARYSVFYTTQTDGTLNVWDILQQQRKPTLSMKVKIYHIPVLLLLFIKK